jgi:hypothetical protein
MDAEDRELFTRSVRHALIEHEGAGIDQALDELGWTEALDDEPQTATQVLFELLGLEGVTSSSLDHVLSRAAGLERISSSFVLPPIGSAEPPGTADASTIRVRGLLRAHEAPSAITLCFQAGDRVEAGQLATEHLTLRAVQGLDPSLGLIEVEGSAPLSLLDGAPSTPWWTSVVAAGSLAVAHELLGASRAMLELARAHALERVQFGQTISTFQAVRHRLAEAYLAIEAAEALVVAAWEDGSAFSASMAKAFTGRQARIAASHCQQVLAGMGFTAEHPYHRFLRRVVVLEQLFGGSSSLTTSLGAELLASRSLPALFPL